MRFIHLLFINICFALHGNAQSVNDPLLFDRFSHIPCQEETTRLDNYADRLKRLPNATGVIVGYGGKNDTRRGEIAARLVGVRNYLIRERKIDQNRIVILNGGYREELNMELWVIENRENANLLKNPTVKSGDVRFKKGSIRKWVYRCKKTRLGNGKHTSD